MNIPLPRQLWWHILLSLAFHLVTTFTVSSQIRSGNSYINLSKRSVGGTVQPGDTLEIRTNYYIPSGTNGNYLYAVRYLDNIPTNTVYIGDSLRLITNEGLTYKRWTNNDGDDAASYIASPPAGDFNIRINIGLGVGVPTNNSLTNLTGAGTVRPDVHRPRVGAGMLITTAFKVRVSGSIGDTITLGAGRLRYRTGSSGGSHIQIAATQYKILISNNDPICSNAIGKNFVAEAGGTFDSSTTQNRTYGPSFPIPAYNYLNLTPGTQLGDGNYAIVNNLSPTASTFQNAQKRPNCVTATGPGACVNRMFGGHWDIIGDHTGSSTPAGNAPEAVGSMGGYMLVVNADYATSEAYRQNITGLCPNTSYEFSLWVRNVCTNCGIDSTGTSNWKPGVLPNLTFAIDDLDRYSSGQIDTVGWVKKGFLFKTGAGQTAITISIRNNASGGGGNDWAVDDISLVTCNPALTLIPTGNSNVCYGNQVDISSTVRAFFPNYTSFRWERSTDGGATWNVTGSGTGLPVQNGGVYEYVASLPSFLADSSVNLNQYRFVVASSPANLGNPDCAFTASTILTVLVNNCLFPLKTSLTTINGNLNGSLASVSWKVTTESSDVIYEVESSNDPTGFVRCATIRGNGANGGNPTYEYHDPIPVSGKRYYRVKMIEGANIRLSKVVMLSNPGKVELVSVKNPFTDAINCELFIRNRTSAEIQLVDAFGRIVRFRNLQLNTGNSVVQLKELHGLAAGNYILRINTGGEVINKKLVKQ